MNLSELEFKNQQLTCPACGKKMVPVLDLAKYPLTEIYEQFDRGDFVPKGFVDQGLAYCRGCGHCKLSTIISPQFLYAYYRTTTSQSAGAVAAIRKFQSFILENADLGRFDAVIDIGANDASLLNCFRGAIKRLVAIDPNVGKHLEPGVGIDVVNDFVENADLSSLRGARNLILCSHTLEHIEHPDKVLANLHDSLGLDDVCVFQYPSLELLVRDARFDQVNHQHMHYFSERSTRHLLNRLGFQVIRLEFDSDHYGSLMVAFRKARSSKSDGLAPVVSVERILESKRVFDLNMSATNLRVQSGTRELVAFGAALMLPILVYYVPALERVTCIVDDDKSKNGLRFVNFNKRIVHSEGFQFDGKDVVVTAVSTKLALRRVTEKLFKLGIDNIIIPLNQV